MKKSSCFFSCLVLLLCNNFAPAQGMLVDAGAYTKVCPGISVGLGGNPTVSGGQQPYTYQWQPTTTLNNSLSSNPTASTTLTTTYTVTVTDAGGEIKKDTVTVVVYNYSINAGPDEIIQQGQTVQLHGQATGATVVSWAPPGANIYNQNTLSPDVFPPYTTTYTFSAVYPGGCTLYDFLTITVIPGKNLFFYNTFTPNGDQENDIFYIGNIEAYPDNVLEIYNRYGQKVFTKTGYQNDWDGKYLNSELPAGTYFYLLDTKTTSGGKHKGSVTIIR